MHRRLLPKTLLNEDALQLLGAHKQLALGDTVRCLVWNILKAKRRDWSADFSELMADRDIVMLQEAVVNAPSDSLFESSTRFEWVMACSHQHPITDVITGVKTGCVAQSQRQVVHSSPYAEPILKTQKLLLETHYELEAVAETLMVLNMHAINFVQVRKYAKQMDQLSVVLDRHKGPVILAGDFNTWHSRRLDYFNSACLNAGLIEANMSRKSKLSHFNQHLDHVFYRGLELQSISSLSQYVSSDHAPITATFRFPSRC